MPRAIPYTDIDPLQPEWLWEGRIPLSEVTIIAGDGGIGKGFLMADLAARVTRGDVMPDGSDDGARPGSVLLVTSEDDPNMAMTYRLRGAGADLSKVYDMTDDFLLPDSLPALRETIGEIGDVRMAVIDPLAGVSSIPITSGNVRIRRILMGPLERLARDTGIALPVIHHTVKSGRVAGGKAITDAARMVLRVSRSSADERIRMIHVEKSNIASDSVGDIAYTVAGTFPDVRVRYLQVPDSVEVVRELSTADKILRVLKDSEPMEPQEIARRTDVSYGAVRVALTRLKRDGKVYSPERGLWTLASLTVPTWPGLEVVK